jgi:hypothetical protein
MENWQNQPTQEIMDSTMGRDSPAVSNLPTSPIMVTSQGASNSVIPLQGASGCSKPVEEGELQVQQVVTMISSWCCKPEMPLDLGWRRGVISPETGMGAVDR